MLCDLVSRKNNKLSILQIFLKSVLTNDLFNSKFHELQGRCLCYGHIHGIVCLNEPILCTHIRLYMQNNVAEESFPLFFHKKTIVHFLSIGKGVCCEACTKNTFENGTTPFF